MNEDQPSETAPGADAGAPYEGVALRHNRRVPLITALVVAAGALVLALAALPFATSGPTPPVMPGVPGPVQLEHALGPEAAPSQELRSDDVRAIWDRMLSTNRIWLTPRPAFLRYIQCAIDTRMRQPEQATQVWVANNRGRSQSDGTWSLSFDAEGAFATDFPRHILPVPMQSASLQPLRQGIAWNTALFVLAETGLPESARIVETRPIPGGQVVVIETELGEKYAQVGGSASFPALGTHCFRMNRTRIHIQLPECVPLREETLTRPGGVEPEVWRVVDFGPSFETSGDQVAPRTMTLYSRTRDTELRYQPFVFQAHFTVLRDVWLLKEAMAWESGNAVMRASIQHALTEPFIPPVPEVPKPPDATYLANQMMQIIAHARARIPLGEVQPYAVHLPCFSGMESN